MATVYDVSAYLISKADISEGDGMTNLKLQKLLYYCQGFALVLLNKPLFTNAIDAWQHGPVVRVVYNAYKSYGGNVISSASKGNADSLSAEERELVDDVYSVYGKYSAWYLRNLTHSEPTWQSVESSDDKTITHKAMKKYFSTLVNNEDE